MVGDHQKFTRTALGKTAIPLRVTLSRWAKILPDYESGRRRRPKVARVLYPSKFLPTCLFTYISSQDPSGFKYRTEHEFHVSAFERIKKLLKPSIALGLCKEDRSMWQDVNLAWQGCHCLHGSRDNVAARRVQILGIDRQSYGRIGRNSR